jgi:hypothetical protein
MAKKQKRQYSRSTASAPVAESAARVKVAPSMAPSPARSNAVVEFNPDYSYVIHDLKKIGIMGGSFIAILIVLSFILK